MENYKKLIEKLISVSERNSNSLNTRDNCKDAADAIEQLVKERDTAIEDISKYKPCEFCKNFVSAEHICEKGLYCPDGSCFEWRGVLR